MTASTSTPVPTQAVPREAAIRVSTTTFADRIAAVAFSPDGAVLVAIEGSDLVWRGPGAGLPELARHNLDGLTPLGLAFAGPDHVALLGSGIVDFSMTTVLRRFAGPDWQELEPIKLGLTTAKTLVGHPSQPWVIAPRPTDDVSVLDLVTGTWQEGRVRVSSREEATVVAWAGDQILAMSSGQATRFDPATGRAGATESLPGPIAALQPAVATASPASLQLPGAEPLALGSPEQHLYALLGSDPARMVALLLTQEGAQHAVQAVPVTDGVAGAPISLSWPLSGAALHPSQPVLVWIQGQLGSAGALRVTNLGSGETLSP